LKIDILTIDYPNDQYFSTLIE